jgi:hypothetical protein
MKSMATYPVHYWVHRPLEFNRLQLAARVLAFIVLGIAGISLGAVFIAAYLALPILAAIRLAGDRAPADYLADDGPRIVRFLGWFAAIYAWFGLTADRLPSRTPTETLELDVAPSGQPTAAAALARLLLGLPSAFVLWLLGIIGAFVWLWAALLVLINERVGTGAYRFLAGLQRWTVRLLAYQAALVDDYPPFSFEDSPPKLPPAMSAEPELPRN